MKIEKEKRKGKDEKSVKKLFNYENFFAVVFAMLLISGVFLALFIPSLLIMLVVFMFWAIALVMVAIVGMDIEMRIKLREKLKMGKEGKKEKNSWKDYK